MPFTNVIIIIIIIVDAPFLSAFNIAATSISISWSWTNNGSSEAVSYKVMWHANDISGCSDGSNSENATSSTSYDIMELEEDSSYIITLTALNNNSSKLSNSVTAMTLEAGERSSYC